MSAESLHILTFPIAIWFIFSELQIDSEKSGSFVSKATLVSVGKDIYWLMETVRIINKRTVEAKRSVTKKIVLTYLFILILRFIILAVQLKKSFIDSKHPKAEIPKKRPATPKKFVIEENKEKSNLLSSSLISVGRIMKSPLFSATFLIINTKA